VGAVLAAGFGGAPLLVAGVDGFSFAGAVPVTFSDSADAAGLLVVFPVVAAATFGDAAGGVKFEPG